MRNFTLTKTVPSGQRYQFEGTLFTSGRVALDGNGSVDCYESMDEMLDIFEVGIEAVQWNNERVETPEQGA